MSENYCSIQGNILIYYLHFPCNIFYRTYGPKTVSRYWICGNGQSYSDALASIEPSSTSDGKFLAQRLVSLCRNSGVTSSSRPAQHFENDDDFYVLDTAGDHSIAEFECPDTLSEMLVIVHQHQANRAQAISTIQQAYAASHSTPTTSRKRTTDYNMFCSPTDKPFTTTAVVDDNENEYEGPPASDMALQRRSAIRDELFDDSDEEEGHVTSELGVQHLSNARDELFDDSD